MSLRHALLALLDVGPMTGYELAKQFDQSVTYLWHAPHSQIYPELRRMEGEGLIEAEALPRGERATKRAYSLTGQGGEALVEWVRRLERPAQVREPAYLRATYFEYESFDDTRHHFTEHRDHYRAVQEQWQQHVALLQRHDTDLMKRRLRASPAAAHDAIVAYKVHAYDGLIERARAEVAWAERGLALVERLEHAGQVPAGDPVTRPQALAESPSHKTSKDIGIS